MIFVLSFDTYTSIKTNITAMIPLPELVVFSLPGGLWIFCVTILSQPLRVKVGKLEIPISIIPVLFAIGLEFCQHLHLTKGTFDLWDITLYVIFWLLAYDPLRPGRPQENIRSLFSLRSFIFLACFLSVYLAHVNQ